MNFERELLGEISALMANARTRQDTSPGTCVRHRHTIAWVAIGLMSVAAISAVVGYRAGIASLL